MKFFHKRKKTQRLFYRTPAWFKGRLTARFKNGFILKKILKKGGEKK